MSKYPPGYVERLEESEGYLVNACADLKAQLGAAVGIIRQLSGKSRDDINTLIAQEIKRTRSCEPGETSSA